LAVLIVGLAGVLIIGLTIIIDVITIYIKDYFRKKARN